MEELKDPILEIHEMIKNMSDRHIRDSLSNAATFDDFNNRMEKIETQLSLINAPGRSQAQAENTPNKDEESVEEGQQRLNREVKLQSKVIAETPYQRI